MRQLLVTALLIAIPASLAAQRPGFAHVSGRSQNFAASRFAHSRAVYYPLGLFDPLYSDYLSSTRYPASQPPVIILQSPPPAAAPETPPAQPLMIELQGDRYVQISGDQRSQAQMIDQVPHAQQPAAPRRPSLAVLVFRDGHRQEVSAYTIADGVLYATADYYTSGAWNQKIELTSLNLSETLASNSSRGLRFQLPSAPNEVIVGP